MSNYVIYKDQALIDSGQPVTHAIVIGVGDYPHLVNGTGTLTNKNGGLKQLSSPPESARTFCNWLLDDFHNPDTARQYRSVVFVRCHKHVGHVGKHHQQDQDDVQS